MSLRLKAISGVRWMSLATAATALIGFGQTITLSRLLSPKDFGLMAMIWTVLGFLQAFADMGMSQAIVQRQNTTAEQLSSVYWANLAGGFAVGFVSWMSTPALVWFFRESELWQLVPWVALAFPIAAIGQPFQMVLQRDMHFRLLAASQVSSACAAASVSIAAAYFGAGAFALVLGGLTAAAVKSFILLISGVRLWRPVLRMRFADLDGFLRFGAYQLGERTANYVWSNADYLAVGRFLGAAQLGVYRLAYETVVRPLATVNPILNTVAYPLFAKKQGDNAALRRGYLELMRVLAAIVSPILGGLAAVAPVAVFVVYGSRWAAAAPVIQILCLLGLLRSLSNPVGSLMLAKGHVKTGFVWNVALAAANAIGFWIAAPFGLQPLAWTAVGILVVMVLVSWKAYYCDTVGLTPGEQLSALRLPILCSALMAVSVWLTGLAIDGLNPPWLRLALMIVAGVIVYAGLYWAFGRRFLREMWTLLRGA